ncbi:Riboflavin biosynthesis protein RibF [Paraliobacillus sp. PM-2]|uniref:riboflavin biosynthesis protein RibF n=1 Tax=Paraliobacillus sp. PM-2 TaxID=1462524 RepID=UPI00061CC145|nr:riboflavin biosynthesis protein RibF [Paraliobacillus sp. PM-2]CQR47652.1 Riboflavin biosynthesis protein RibF [Paraliobacillus sp. PM-2]
MLQVISLCYPQHLQKIKQEEAVAAIGFFDGIHKGHQKVIKEAQVLAKQQNRKSAVITFSPHPSVVLNNNKQDVHYLTPLSEKQSILADMGIDLLYIIAFDHTLSQLSPKAFIDHFIIGLNIKHLVTGFDFTYGHKGKGNIHTLAADAAGCFEITVIDKLENENEKVSSTRIRELLVQGNVEKVTELMDRPLTTSGTVIEGEKRGRTIGYPTANIDPDQAYAIPKAAVYGVKVWVKEHCVYGMANIGYKPTFHDKNESSQLTVEVHLFDFNQAIYGEQVKIEWRVFIREEQKFTGIDALINQLKQDEQRIRQFFSLITD